VLMSRTKVTTNMSPKTNNIYSHIPNSKRKEVFQALLHNKNVKIERIISCGQATKKDKWLKTRHVEWVILLKGAAKLKFRKNNRLFNLKSGDYILIPANTPHRVEWTHPRTKTIWLAVHF